MEAIPSGTKTPENPLGIGTNPTYQIGDTLLPIYVVPIWEDGELIGYTTAGFAHLATQRDNLLKELVKLGEYGDPKKVSMIATADLPADEQPGTLSFYYAHREVLHKALARHNRTGWKSKLNLTKQLIGHEGSIVEVEDCHGDTRAFLVGRSGGYIPCHIEIPTTKDDGGVGAYGTPYKSVRVIHENARR